MVLFTQEVCIHVHVYYYYYHRNHVLLLLIVEKLKVHYIHVYNSWQFSHLKIVSFIYFCTIVHGIIFVNYLLFNTMTLNTM